MQCSNCQFQNIPGVHACGRCGASLQLASLTIDVHPPRASLAAKRWRRWFPATLYWNRLRAAAASVIAARRMLDWAADVPAFGLLVRMVVPGWTQRYAGRPLRGKCIFGCFLALFLPGLLFLGTALGSVLLGLALSLHAASIMDIVAARIPDFRRRLIYSAAAVIVLAVVVYYPAGWLLTRVASPLQFNLAAPPFDAGDVVLLNPSAYRWFDPQPGDVVYFDRRLQDLRMQVPGGYAQIYRLQGARVDRILARGGDKVACLQGQLLVNGQASPWLPLNPSFALPDSLKTSVPENCYLILPSADALYAEMWRSVSIVPRRQIGGRVYWRTQPLSRFGAIR